jgi:hypothetical protein
MSTITLELEDETSSLLQTEARRANLTPGDFAKLTLIRALARTGTDPLLESKTRQATGQGWQALRQFAQNSAPHPDDEIHPANHQTQ